MHFYEREKKKKNNTHTNLCEQLKPSKDLIKQTG